MRFFIKLAAVAMSAAIVFGCGATLNASETRYNIDEYFTDPAFNRLIRTYDSNSDGYLTDAEVFAGTRNGYMMSIEDTNIKSLDGLEVLPELSVLSLEVGAGKIDLSSCKTKYVLIIANDNLKFFVCGSNQETVNFLGDCKNLKKAFFNYAKNLKNMMLSGPSLTGDLCLENSPKLQRLIVTNTGYKNIYCSDQAKLTQFTLWGTPLRNLEIPGTGYDDLELLTISTDGTLNGIYAKGDLARFLWEHGLFRPNEYLFYEEDGKSYKINNTGYSIMINGKIYD